MVFYIVIKQRQIWFNAVYWEGTRTELKCKLAHNTEKYAEEFNGTYITIKPSSMYRFAMEQNILHK